MNPLQKSIALFQAGRFEDAKTLLLGVVESEKADPQFQLMLGHVYAKLAQQDEAERYYSLYMSQVDDGDAAVALGSLYRNGGDLLKALSAFEQARKWGAKSIPSIALYASVLKELGRLDDATPIWGELTKKTALSNEEKNIQSAAWLELGDIDRALAHAGEDQNAWTREQFQCRPKGKALYESFSELPTIEGTLPQGEGLLILLSGSGDYFSRFGKGLISSIIQNCENVRIHLHIMDMHTGEDLRYIHELPKARVTLTTENLIEPDNTTYSSRRFLRIPQFIESWSGWLLSLDLDSRVCGNIEAEVDTWQEADTAVYFNTAKFLTIQTQVNASILGISTTQPGKAFAEAVAAYILYFDLLNEKKWFIEQVAIVAVAQWIKDEYPDFNLQKIEDHVINLSHSDRPSLIVSAPGAEKSILN